MRSGGLTPFAVTRRDTANLHRRQRDDQLCCKAVALKTYSVESVREPRQRTDRRNSDIARRPGMETEEQQRLVRAALEELSEEFRTAIVLTERSKA